MPKAYVIKHDELGIFLGTALGLTIWSKLDPIGQTHAVAVESMIEAKHVIFEILRGREGLTAVEVDVAMPGWASVAECVHAGLEGWLDNRMPVVGGLQ